VPRAAQLAFGPMRFPGVTDTHLRAALRAAAGGCSTPAGFAPPLTRDYTCGAQESRELASNPQELDFSPELDLLP
jgi:hypothetical protein